MNTEPILRIGSVKEPARFKEHLLLGFDIPCHLDVKHGAESPLRRPLERRGIRIGNRIAVQPMEGWDGEPDGTTSARTLRRWQRFGSGGAKLIWGGEAVAVCHEGRANPNQLVIASHTEAGIAKLRSVLIDEHRCRTGSDHGLLIGLQLTHSGRYCRPNFHNRGEPQILYAHPILDRRMPNGAPELTSTTASGPQPICTGDRSTSSWNTAGFRFFFPRGSCTVDPREKRRRCTETFVGDVARCWPLS